MSGQAWLHQRHNFIVPSGKLLQAHVSIFGGDSVRVSATGGVWWGEGTGPLSGAMPLPIYFNEFDETLAASLPGTSRYI